MRDSISPTGFRTGIDCFPEFHATETKMELKSKFTEGAKKKKEKPFEKIISRSFKKKKVFLPPQMSHKNVWHFEVCAGVWVRLNSEAQKKKKKVV